MSKVLKNWSYLLFSDVIQQIVGFVVVILLARKLSPDGYGLYNVIISIATIFSVVAHFGMSNVVIRELSLNPETTASFIKKIIIPFRIASFIFAVIAFFIYGMINVNADNTWSIYVVLIILNLSLWNFSESIAFGHEVTKYSSILNIIISLVWLASILIIPDKLLVVNTILLVYCLLHFIKGVSYSAIIYKEFYLPQPFKSQKSTVSRMQFFKMVLPYIWLLLIVTLSNQLPIQFLNTNSNLDEVGFYAVGFKLMIPISIVVGTAFKAIFPSLTRLYANDKLEFQNKLKLGFNLIIVFGTLIAIVASLSSYFWLTLIFGDEYSSAVMVFNFLIWFSVLSILDSLLSNGLSSAYKERVLAIIATIDVIIILPLLYYASSFGAWGLAFVKLTTGTVFLGYHLYVFVKVLNVKIFNKNLILLLGFYFTALSICLFMENQILQLLLITILLLILIIMRNSPIIETFNYVRLSIKKIRV
tara:strand:+ start:524 stop:1945 length:1422 start_codon:yes stop_codon:yes gene_type:complete